MNYFFPTVERKQMPSLSSDSIPLLKTQNNNTISSNISSKIDEKKIEEIFSLKQLVSEENKNKTFVIGNTSETCNYELYNSGKCIIKRGKLGFSQFLQSEIGAGTDLKVYLCNGILLRIELENKILQINNGTGFGHSIIYPTYYFIETVSFIDFIKNYSEKSLELIDKSGHWLIFNKDDLCLKRFDKNQKQITCSYIAVTNYFNDTVFSMENGSTVMIRRMLKDENKEIVIDLEYSTLIYPLVQK